MIEIDRGKEKTIGDGVQNIVEKIQFRMDIFPGLPCQPLPWIGLHKSKRGIGTAARWKAIDGAISKMPIQSALDIGSNAGFFAFNLGVNNIPTIGREMNDSLFRIARYAAKKLNLGNVSFLKMDINDGNVHLLPKVDIVLLLSVWHHWVRNFGFDAVTRLLSTVWSRCGVSLFFESGEGEMPEEYGLPDMLPTAREWFTTYPQQNCQGSRVDHLGVFKAFALGGDETESVVYRNLFQVKSA